MALQRLRYVLLVPALLLLLAPLSAWGQKEAAKPPKATADQGEVVKRLQDENARLKQRVMTLIEQNNMLTENLMNCIEDLQGCESGQGAQPQDQPKESQ